MLQRVKIKKYPSLCNGEGLAEDNLSFSLPFEKHDDC